MKDPADTADAAYDIASTIRGVDFPPRKYSTSAPVPPDLFFLPAQTPTYNKNPKNATRNIHAITRRLFIFFTSLKN